MKKEIREKTDEIAIRDDLASIYDIGFNHYRNTVEYISVFKSFKIDRLDLVLEVGAGTGRFSVEFIRRGAEVVVIDYSRNSLRINRSKCDCHAILADLCFLPLRSAVFDKAASINCFQHVPTWKSRMQGLREILRILRKDSLFLITAYNFSSLRKFHNRRKQGYFKTGERLLYYYSFDRLEFKWLLLSVFSEMVDFHGMLILISLQELFHRIKLTKIALQLEILFQKTILSYLLGSFLLAIVKKNDLQG